MYYRFIFKKDLPKYEAQGWEFVKDIEFYISSKTMKKVMGFQECLIKREEDSE